MDIQYTLASHGDLDILMQFVAEFYQLDGHQFDPPTMSQALTDLIAHEQYGRVWLIAQGDRPIGYVVLTFGYSLEYHGRDAIVDEIYLQEPFRGQGIGKQTFAFVEAACRQLGIHALHLEVMTANEAAYDFYRRLGYEGRPSHFLHKWL